MSYGYSLRLIEKNKEADASHIGVRLGRKCIEHKIPVSVVASNFDVTRQTVYNWFRGNATPADPLILAIEAFLAEV